MRKLILFLLICTIFTFGFSAKNGIGETKSRKIVTKFFTGDYIKASNTFTYKKDNLIFPDKTIIYTVKPMDDSLERIFNYLKLNYEVKENQKVNLEIIGRVTPEGILEVYKVNNYIIPEENMKGRENYMLFGQ